MKAVEPGPTRICSIRAHPILGVMLETFNGDCGFFGLNECYTLFVTWDHFDPKHFAVKIGNVCNNIALLELSQKYPPICSAEMIADQSQITEDEGLGQWFPTFFVLGPFIFFGRHGGHKVKHFTFPPLLSPPLQQLGDMGSVVSSSSVSSPSGVWGPADNVF